MALFGLVRAHLFLGALAPVDFVGDSSLPLHPIGVDTAPALGGFDSSTRYPILAHMAGKSLRGRMLDELQVVTDILLDGEAEGSVVLWALEVISLPCPLVKKGRDRKCFRSSFGFYHPSSSARHVSYSSAHRGTMSESRCGGVKLTRRWSPLHYRSRSGSGYPKKEMRWRPRGGLSTRTRRRRRQLPWSPLIPSSR